MGINSLLFFIVPIFILYGGRVLKYTYALRVLDKCQKKSEIEPDLRMVTLIIPARNESSRITKLFDDLQNQDYPEDYLEVIFVDDHSTDDTANAIKEIASRHKNFIFLSLPKDKKGKKAAIDYGVKQASGDWIIQTDADCRLPGSFISGHVKSSQRPDTVLVVGAVKYIPLNGIFDKFERLEFYALAAVTLGSIIMKKPVMCNAANMSYLKGFYLASNDLFHSDRHPSGDDLFLLEAAKRNKKIVGFMAGKDTIVSTYGTGNLKQFINQRIRWGSKARYYKNSEMIFVTLLFFIMNFLLSIIMVMAIFFPELLIWTGLLLLLKSIFDGILINRILFYFDQRSLMRFFPFAAIMYHFYLAITGIISLLAGFSWKERFYN